MVKYHHVQYLIYHYNNKCLETHNQLKMILKHKNKKNKISINKFKILLILFYHKTIIIANQKIVNK